MRILFVDDHHLVRDALTWFLCKSDESIDVVGAGNVAEALGRADAEFDLVLLDYKMPGLSGLPAIQAIQEGFPEAPIIVLSGAVTHAEACQALDAGVAGVISKDVAGDQLWDAIRSHMNGVSSISPSIGEAAAPGSPALPVALSKRELQVANLLVAGHPNKTIANMLGIAEITVRLNLRQIYRKLGARSRTDAVRMMMQRAM